MHPRKKDGQQKSKKNARMREAVKERHENAAPEKPSSDQHDVIGYKQGSRGDDNHPQNQPPPPKV